jgi:hypothetical protein
MFYGCENLPDVSGWDADTSEVSTLRKRVVINYDTLDVLLDEDGNAVYEDEPI